MFDPAVWSDPWQITAQIIGLVAMSLGLFCYLPKTRKKILVMKFLTDFIWGFHYCMLGHYSGGCVTFANSARDIVFYNKGKKWASTPLWVVLFIAINLGSAILSWRGPVSLLPAVGSSLAVLGLWCTNEKLLRLLNFIGVAMWTVYNLVVFSLPAIISNIFNLVSLIIAMVREHRKKEA